MYSKEDTVKVFLEPDSKVAYISSFVLKCLLGKKADPSIPGGPQGTNSVHLAASRPTTQVTDCIDKNSCLNFALIDISGTMHGLIYLYANYFKSVEYIKFDILGGQHNKNTIEYSNFTRKEPTACT